MNLREIILKDLATGTRTALERAIELRAKSAYLTDHTLVCRVLGDYMLYADGRDVSLTPHLSLSGYWEMPVTQFIARTVKPGMRCIDVGANCGYFTVLLGALVGETGQVFAWEPNSRLAELLTHTVSVNGFGDRVAVIDKAASNHSHIDTLSIPGAMWGSASLKKDSDVRNKRELVACRGLDDSALALDSRASRWNGKVDFIKIDAEGHEPEIWDGAEQILSENRNVTVLLEFTPARYVAPGTFLSKFKTAGFEIRAVNTEGWAEPISAEKLLDEASFQMVVLKRPES